MAKDFFIVPRLKIILNELLTVCSQKPEKGVQIENCILQMMNFLYSLGCLIVADGFESILCSACFDEFTCAPHKQLRAQKLVLEAIEL